MDKEVLEVILKNSARESKIKHIIDAKWESAVPQGENYTSSILRVTLKVVLGNGRIGKKSFIAKKEVFGEAVSQLNKDYQVFKKEASTYIDIFREMDYMMEEFGDTEGPLWCELIYFSQADGIIILEDLKASGFTTVKRTELQDLEHARLALRSLGRYHAMAKVLEGRGLISKDNYKPFLLFDENYIKIFIYGGIQALVKGMRASWGKEWSDTADKLGQMSFEELSKRIQDSGNFDDNTFKCLNHGDCWSNNMMFKHNWEGKPTEIRFVDLQLSHYNSPCVDLVYYINSSIQPHVRRQNYNSLLELYHNSLTSSLDRFGYKGNKPSLGEIKKGAERLSLFVLSAFAGLFPVVTSKTIDSMDINKVFETSGEEGFSKNIYSEDGLIEQMGEDIKKLAKLHDIEYYSVL